MKTLFLILLFPAFLFGQIKREISLRYPLKDYPGTTKDIYVIDARKDKSFKPFVSRGKYYQFHFPTGDAEKDIKDWFEKFNKNRKKGSRDILFYLEKLKIANEVIGGEIFCVLDLKASTFVKDESSYHFLTRYDNVLKLSTKEYTNLPVIFEENIGRVFQKLLFDSYRTKPIYNAIPKESLSEYEYLLKKTTPVFNASTLKNGVYVDCQEFFSQNPKEGYTISFKENGKVEAIGKDGNILSQRKIGIYVNRGSAYKNTNIGFLPLEKDERGFYIMSNRTALFPEEIKVSPVYFFFGIAGGIAAGIATSVKHNNAINGEKNKIYLDFLTCDYSFTE